MVSEKYRNAYTEVYTILSYLEVEEYNKIPSEIINAIENNMNEEYEYHINEEVDLFNQPMMEETKATLFNIFRDYLSTPEQKEKIYKMQMQDRIKLERKKQENSINLFENKKNKEIVKNKNESGEKNLAMQIESNSWYRKIINFFKNIFMF